MEQDKNLAKNIAKELASLVYSECVSIEGLAYMLGMGINSSALYQVVNTPGFPRPITFTDGGHKKWSRQAVKDWIKAQFDNDNLVFMKALKAAI